MADVSNLIHRIDAEFTAMEKKVQQLQKQSVQAYQDREQRFEQFVKLLDELRGTWQPRLEALAKRFGERVKVTPSVVPARREAVFAFQSPLARIRLRFSASTNEEVTKAIFSYDLEILPILMQFESHAECEFPLDAVDQEALGRWFDDRIVAFVRTYLSLHENEYYLKDHMVEDPVARVRFPKYAAGATLEWKGQTYYFVGSETLREFQKKQGVKAP
jgi:YHS domain-containing protein